MANDEKYEIEEKFAPHYGPASSKSKKEKKKRFRVETFGLPWELTWRIKKFNETYLDKMDWGNVEVRKYDTLEAATNSFEDAKKKTQSVRLSPSGGLIHLYGGRGNLGYPFRLVETTDEGKEIVHEVYIPQWFKDHYVFRINGDGSLVVVAKIDEDR